MREIDVDVRLKQITSANLEIVSFGEGRIRLESEEYKIISLKENARLRINEGIESIVSQDGNWVSERIVYIPGKGKFLTKIPFSMQEAIEATNEDKKGDDFYLTDEQIERTLACSIQLPDENFEIPLKEFGKDTKYGKITKFILEEEAKNYGRFLKRHLKKFRVKEIPVHTVKMQDKPFTRQLWFCSIEPRARLFSDDKPLYSFGRIRGIKEVNH